VDIQPEAENSRKNRARERHQRRKEREQGMAQSASVQRQIRSPASFKLPEIHLPANRLLMYGLGGVIVVMLVIYALGRLKNDEPLPDSNAIWIGAQWTYDNPTDEAITALVGRLRQNRIGTVYAWVSLLQPDGAWTEVSRLESVTNFISRFKAAYPTVQIYGWLSIGSQGVDGNNRLSDSAVQENIANFSQRMVGEFEFDGVLLNVVPIASGDDSYLSLLRKVRSTIGDSATLAVAVPPDWTPQDTDIPTPSQIAPGTVWADDYKQRVALLADQLFVAGYNAGFNTADEYSAWVAYQVETYAKAIADLDTTTQLLIGVPTYDLIPPDHDPDIENPTSAINGIRSGLSNAGAAASFVTGIGIYAEWETSPEEWNEITSLWGNP
jgi:hypothetical protein